MICAIGTKEAGHITMPLAVSLIFFRERRLTKEMLAFIVPSLFLFVFRRIVVPNHWEPALWTSQAFKRSAYYWGAGIITPVRLEAWWVVISGLLVVSTVLLGMRVRARLRYVLIFSVLGAGLCAQYIGSEGTWALLFEPHSQVRLASIIVYIGALAVFWRYRKSEPGVLCIFWIIAASTMIMGYAGYHYYYWPSAIIAIADAVCAACIVRLFQEYAKVQRFSLKEWILSLFPKTQAENAA